MGMIVLKSSFAWIHKVWYFLSYRNLQLMLASIFFTARRLKQEEFDLVGIDRSLLAEPAWANKLHDGRMEEIKTFTPELLPSLV